MLARALVLAALAAGPADDGPKDAKAPSSEALVAKAVAELVAMQEGGEWPYEGVYRVRGEIPLGYRVGGSSLVSIALLHAAAPDDAAAASAIDRSLGFVLKALEDRELAPSTADRYDVRIWGHACALELLCRLREAGRLGKRAAAAEKWIEELVATIVREELTDGGWNYATRRAPAAFVTAPVVQALLLARSQGNAVPDDVLQRARGVLEAARLEGGAFAYSGASAAGKQVDGRQQLPGSVARSAACEATLLLLGGGDPKALAESIEAFHEHWGELEKRRKKTGTHLPPYGIAPYYFYFGHRYAAQAIEMLPADRRATERARLKETLLRTRDEDGTWNDRVFPRSRNYGTAMAVLALLGERAPRPADLAADSGKKRKAPK